MLQPLVQSIASLSVRTRIIGLLSCESRLARALAPLDKRTPKIPHRR